jgi:hypothetical protein
VIVSLNEIEGVALKAARGAGLAWGVAEEVAEAAGWLARRDVPWAAALADLLQHGVGAGEASPIEAGIRLADRALLAEPAGPLILAWPVLFVPFVARVAPAVGAVVSWHGGSAGVRAAAGGTEVRDGEGLAVPRLDGVMVRPGGGGDGRWVGPRAGGRAVDPGVWRILEGLAARTYVPESEASRLTGAGAGLSDND